MKLFRKKHKAIEPRPTWPAELETRLRNSIAVEGVEPINFGKSKDFEVAFELAFEIANLPVGTWIRTVRPKAKGSKFAVSFKGGPDYYGHTLIDALTILYKRNKEFAEKYDANTESYTGPDL